MIIAADEAAMQDVRRVTIAGGGSLAHALAATIGADESLEVCVLSRQPQRWARKIRAIYLDVAEVVGRIHEVSDDPAIVAGSDVVLLAVPQVAIDRVLGDLRPHVGPATWIGAIPGYGGIDWRYRALFGGRDRFFGLQRVPYVRKTISYGEYVWISGIRPQLFLAALPSALAPQAARLVEMLLGIPTAPIGSYLGINLTTTNPTFHPARLYSAFGHYPLDQTFDRVEEFYEAWDDAASATFLELDAELRAISKAIPGGVPGLRDLQAHYGVSSVPALTRVIRSIRALRNRALPLRAVARGYRLDPHTPFFTEDIAFGLLAIRGIAQVVGVRVPMMDAILRWGQRCMGRRLLDQGGRIAGDEAHPFPERFGIDSATKLAYAAAN